MYLRAYVFSESTLKVLILHDLLRGRLSCIHRDEENDAVCTVVVPLKEKRNHSPKFRLYVDVILGTTSTHARACFPAAEVASTALAKFQYYGQIFKPINYSFVSLARAPPLFSGSTTRQERDQREKKII